MLNHRPSVGRAARHPPGEHTASITAHEAVGFRSIGRRERIGQFHGVWRDNFLLERRSNRT